MVGGIPLSLLRSGSGEEIREGLEGIVPPLLESGRYVPLAGGRVREEIGWPIYKYYREVLAGLLAKPGPA